MDDIRILLDAPGEPKSRLQIAALGDFNSGKYGEFSITAADIASWQRNLDKLPGKRALIDLDHQADRTPRNTEAAGWITGVSLDGGTPMADVEWTPVGQKAIEEKRYLFFSPTYGTHKNERGEAFDNTLLGGALTNRPFLGGMPAITLASDERVSAALDEDPSARFYQHALDGDLGDEARALVLLDVSQAERDKAHANGNSLPDKSYPINNAKQLHAAAILAASGHGDVAAAKKLIRKRAGELGVDVTTLPGFAAEKNLDAPSASDSRAPMAIELDTAALLKSLGLDEAADETKILEAITELQDKATTPDPAPANEPARTLEQQAADAGKIVLDADTWNTTKSQAEAGARVAKELHADRFERAFTDALKDRKVTPSEKDRFQKFYELDADETLAMLDDREPVRPAGPSGAPAIELDAEGNAAPEQLIAAGVHPGSHNLDQQIRKHMLDNKLPESAYAKVMEQVASGAVRL